mmetsp:Transcript_10770/g.17528  ORF Transcript_10770/g.17528 Transcript_10770/m.17528 type:complete len:90 (+) Transcript_10770:85-354(+)
MLLRYHASHAISPASKERLNQGNRLNNTVLIVYRMETILKLLPSDWDTRKHTNNGNSHEEGDPHHELPHHILTSNGDIPRTIESFLCHV